MTGTPSGVGFSHDPQAYLRAGERREEISRLDRFFKSIGMDAISIRTDRSYVEPLTRFFRARARRFR